MTILIQIAGWFLLCVACDINRNEDSKIRMFDKNWFIQLILILAGVQMANYVCHS